MTNHDYLLGIIDDQQLSEAQLSGLQTLRGQIETVLRNRYGTSPRIYYAGSYGKNTLIKEAYDLDIVIYFPSTETATLKEIYESVGQTLRNGSYIVQQKNVALRLPYEGGFHIDVVPGKAQDATFYYATLYKSETGSSLQTSIKKHIDHVQPVKNTVKLMKLWKLRKQVDLETFALEIIVVKALTGLPKDNYEKNLLKIFVYMRDNIEDVKLIDPANTNNEIDISYLNRLALKQAAIAAIAAPLWSDIFG